MGMLLASYPDIYQLHLLTGREEKTMAFYESLGFKAVDELDCVAYTYVKRQKEAGTKVSSLASFIALTV